MNKIKEYWEQRGLEEKNIVTHRDDFQVEIEAETISKYLNKDDRALDVGCGNGYSTKKYARYCKEIVGIDFSKSMINTANNNRPSNSSFIVCDILNFNLAFYLFDKVISTRCLINIPTWERQKQAILNIYNLLEDKGIFILAEGSRFGRNRLNDLRVKMGLKRLSDVWFNNDFEDDKLFEFLTKLFTIKYDIRFGKYDYLTRVYYPLVVGENNVEYNTEFHKAASMCEMKDKKYMYDEFWKYSREFILILEKK